MFAAGDKIVHSRYGAGTVQNVRCIERDGQEQEYLSIELVEDRGTLLIPSDQLEDAELRPAMQDVALIRKVLRKPPEELADHHRTRQSRIESKLNSGDPRQIAQTLRDLCWREATDRLTHTDTRLKNRALKLLAEELALNPSFALQTAKQRLDNIVDKAIQAHMDSIPAEAS